MELGFLRDSIAHEWGRPNDRALRNRIEKHIISCRATIIQRRYDNTKIFPESLLITVEIKDLVKRSSESCGCSSRFALFSSTAAPLPKPIIVKDESYFSFVGGGAFENSFGYIPSHELDTLGKRRYTSNQIFYTIINDYIYIVGKADSKGISKITVKYLPDNPLDLLKIGACSGSCFKDGKFYIEESLVEGILGLMEKRRPRIANEANSEIEIDG